MLREQDHGYLEQLGLPFESTVENGVLCVVIRGWPLPSGYNPAKTDLLLRLPPGFPDAQPDMYWCDPPVTLATTGTYPVAAEQFEEYLGRRWQRFSRHLNPGHWLAGRDSLKSYLALIRRDLASPPA
jgi:hypothetical protein